MKFNYTELSAEDEEIVQSLPSREVPDPVWADVFHQIYTAPNGSLTVTGRDYGGSWGAYARVPAGTTDEEIIKEYNQMMEEQG